MKKLIVFGALATAVAVAYVAFDLGQWLSLGGMQRGLGALQELYAQHPAVVVAGFIAVYVVTVALSIPAAAALTPLAGAIFGLGPGLVVASFSATVGATAAMAVARYFLRDAAAKTAGPYSQKILTGFAKDGAFYLFSLRLVPIIPFFAINLGMGLTTMRTWQFAWVSWLGMLPGTFVYVNAGTQLATLNSLADVASPALWASFAALAALPWIGKALLGIINHRTTYARFTAPKKYDNNLIVIGAGAAGLVSAYIGATVNAKVTLIEHHRMGGDCLNYGCVPSKTLITAAHTAATIRHSAHVGVTSTTPTTSWHNVAAHIRHVITQIEPHDSPERYTALGVNVVQGHATLTDPWTVRIAHPDGSTSSTTARNIIIATGAAPTIPDIPGLETSGFVTSDTLWEHLDSLDGTQERVVVIGGGPIGCELSQAFARLGAHVTQLEQGERLLAREDTDVSDVVAQALSADGVVVQTGARVVRCEQNTVGQGPVEKTVVVECAGRQEVLPYDLLVVSVGRSARLSGFGLAELGVEVERVVVTDRFLRTSLPNVFAVGDVVGPFQLTHVAAHQAWYASVNALFGVVKKFAVDYRVVPQVTFVAPEVARVGLTEREAQEQGVAVEVTRFDVAELDRAITAGARGGFVKVLTVPGKDKIVGVTIVAAQAGEMLAEFVLAMKHGVGLSKVLGTIHPYPTWAEGNKYAAGEWKKAHAPQRLLAVAAKFHTWRRK